MGVWADLGQLRRVRCAVLRHWKRFCQLETVSLGCVFWKASCSFWRPERFGFDRHFYVWEATSSRFLGAAQLEGFGYLVLQSDLLISLFEVTWACERSLRHSKKVTLKKLVDVLVFHTPYLMNVGTSHQGRPNIPLIGQSWCQQITVSNTSLESKGL